MTTTYVDIIDPVPITTKVAWQRAKKTTRQDWGGFGFVNVTEHVHRLVRVADGATTQWYWRDAEAVLEARVDLGVSVGVHQLHTAQKRWYKAQRRSRL